VTLPPTTLISVRRIGAYSASFLPPFSAKDAYWTALEAWAQSRGAPYRREPWGFYPDSPGVTPPDLQRADICLPVDGEVEGEGAVRRLDFEGGAYAVIEHLGPYETVDQAYRGCADGIRRSTQYVFREGPPLQVFRRWRIDGDPDLNLCEVAFPVVRRR
jgi:DNA gyrase inhibitor GyrI